VKIKNLYINNLRNHSSTEVEFSEGLNILFGLNGSGKTTILEALSLAAFSRTFLPTSDINLIKFNENEYSIKTNAVNDYGIPYSVKIKYIKGKSKNISSNIGENISPKELIGEIPCVILSPDYKSITFGSPQNRRDFLDKLLSQASRKYLNILLDFRKALKQRNVLLYKAKTNSGHNRELLSTWTELLMASGAEIVVRRIEFLNNFAGYFSDVYKFVSDDNEKVNLEYLPNSVNSNKSLDEIKVHDVMSSYQAFLDYAHNDEIRRGITLFGPQRDELNISINGGIAKDTASQGQHKSLLISMKFAEFNYLRTIRNETPVALLDDIFSELDKQRANKVLALLESGNAQTFITLTDAESLLSLIPNGMVYKLFRVTEGRINEEK